VISRGKRSQGAEKSVCCWVRHLEMHLDMHLEIHLVSK